MATAIFTGPHQAMTFGSASFIHGEERPVSDEIAARLAGHPWFTVLGTVPASADALVESTAPAEQEPRRRGRPRKVPQ